MQAIGIEDMTILTSYKDIDHTAWSALVADHPVGNVFQTPNYYSVLAITEHNTPIVVAAFCGEEMVGVVVGTVVTNGNNIAKWATARSIIIGGPIVKKNDIKVVTILLEAYRRLLPSYVIYTEIRPIYSLQSLNIEDCGFKRVGHYNLMMDITRPVEELFEGMHKERKRNVKQAEKAGLVFREITEKVEIADVTQLIRKTYKRKHVPMSYLGIFDIVYDKMSDYVHFFGAWAADGKMIAGQVRLCYGQLMYAWFAGSDETYFKQRPNDFLMWNVIRWGHEQGYALFDFGGGGSPDKPYGVRDYKLKYGCECRDYGRYIYVHRPATYFMAVYAYNMLQKIQNKGKV